MYQTKTVHPRFRFTKGLTQNFRLAHKLKNRILNKIPQLYPTEILDFNPPSYSIELCLLLF